MRALHIAQKDPIKNIEEVIISQSKFDVAYGELYEYLEQVKTTKNTVEFKEHEVVVSRLIYALGQAALSEVLSQYDATCDVLSVEEQSLRRKYKAPKEYQTALGPVTIERHVYVNRKKMVMAKAFAH